MKKMTVGVLIVLICCMTFVLGFGYKKSNEPGNFYQVYLDDQMIGTITSKEELERYIDIEGEHIKKKYGVKTVYAPNGLEIKKITSFDANVDKVKDVYDAMKEQKPFTIKGQKITLKNGEEESKFYVLEESIFRQAIENVMIIFVGKEKYEMYRDKTQAEIETTGRKLENLYIEGDMTIKEMQIPVTETIYTNAEDLTNFLVFGENNQTKDYVVQLGDTIATVAFNNEISVEEFLISNPGFTSEKNLLFPNQTVKIGIIDPQIKVVTDEFVVEDIESNYQTETRYDDTQLVGYNQVLQEGENGLERISQNVKSVNGTIVFVNPAGKDVLKPSVNRIIVKGSHYVPNVGSLTDWAWPTDSGWTITSYFAWRINPINGVRELHDALDIAGTGYGSNIYAANNGTVEKTGYTNINGNYVIINHNNGYYTYYGHMSRIIAIEGTTVERGSVIGLIGSTGWATGPHVHFGLFRGYPYYGGTPINPLSVY